MSVTFNQAEFPFATYSSGVLNLYFDKEKQFESAQAFEDEIQKCLEAGGVTLPDDVSIKFSFENLPASTSSVVAKATVSAGVWDKALDQASADKRFVCPAGATTYAKIGFATNDATDTEYNKAKIVFADAGTAALPLPMLPQRTAAHGLSISTLLLPWLISIRLSRRLSQMTLRLPLLHIPPASTFPAHLTLSRPQLLLLMLPGGVGADFALVRSNAKVGAVSATAGQAGEFANDYKIVFKYVSNYDAPSAQWDDNTLTISVTNKEYTDDADFVADVNAAITAAAGGNSKKLFTFDAGSFEGIKDLTNGQRKQLFGGNPSLSFGGGEDSFYTTVAKNLSTFNLTDGRKGGEQTYKDLENVTVQQDGTIIGKHAVHGYLNLGRIDIATFDNPNGLSAVGGTLFEQTVASGEPKVAIAGQEGAGEVVSGALEMSNVDLAQEFTDMITTQRGYQANSRVITTSDTMLEELLSLKR